MFPASRAERSTRRTICRRTAIGQRSVQKPPAWLCSSGRAAIRAKSASAGVNPVSQRAFILLSRRVDPIVKSPWNLRLRALGARPRRQITSRSSGAESVAPEQPNESREPPRLRRQLRQIGARPFRCAIRPARPAGRRSIRQGGITDTKWVTRANCKVDRTASAWLIRRYIDSTAEFRFRNRPGSRAG